MLIISVTYTNISVISHLYRRQLFPSELSCHRVNTAVGQWGGEMLSIDPKGRIPRLARAALTVRIIRRGPILSEKTIPYYFHDMVMSVIAGLSHILENDKYFFQRMIPSCCCHRLLLIEKTTFEKTAFARNYARVEFTLKNSFLFSITPLSSWGFSRQ